MKNIFCLLTFFLITLSSTLCADSSFTLFASRWDTDNAGEGDGYGGRLKQTFLSIGSVEAHGSVIDMDDKVTTLYPVDLSVNIRIPFIISPYAGVGVGYTFMDSVRPTYEDMSTVYAQLGIEVTFVWFGLMAEVRMQDAENDAFDGTTANAGILIKW